VGEATSEGAHATGPPRDLTILERALLGLVALEARSGYDLHKLFAESPMGLFSSSPGAIYPALGRLEEWGLLEAELQGDHEARPRRIYSISGAGRAALASWLHEQATPEEVQNDLPAVLLRFVFAELALSRAESIEYLTRLRETVQDYIAELEEYRVDLEGQPLLHPALAVAHGIEGHRATLEWIDRTIRTLAEAPEPEPIREG
jgi:DNA-binding PadR family transcriptional regulator